MLRRIAAITSVLLATGLFTVGSAAVANAATKQLSPAGTEAQLSADGTYSCGTPFVLQNSYDGGNGQYFYSRVGSPYQLLANTAHTGYCDIPVPGDTLYLVVPDNTSDCLTVDTSTGGVDGTACNTSNESEWINFISVPSGVEVQFWGVTKDCVYQDGRDSPVDYGACDPSVSGDVWLLQ